MTRDRLLCTLLLLALGGVGCTEKSDKKSPSEAAVLLDKKSASPPSADITADSAFLVAACEASGMSTQACTCAGENAKTALGGRLLAKMAKAPADEDPALKRYYTGAEIEAMMTWVDNSSSECGFEESAQ